MNVVYKYFMVLRELYKWTIFQNQNQQEKMRIFEEIKNFEVKMHVVFFCSFF